jgi:hypothetical protein
MTSIQMQQDLELIGQGFDEGVEAIGAAAGVRSGRAAAEQTSVQLVVGTNGVGSRSGLLLDTRWLPKEVEHARR